ncbi:MAG: VWA domain-containing protein [Myxococcales bacterium]|nr:VWA domain-containing protein [Myxococcales bacterium]
MSQRSRMSKLGRIGAAAALLWLASGCLKLTLYQAAVMKPSQIAMYFNVLDSAGNPVPNLTADRFEIYEDGGRISTFESKQTILNPEIAAIHYTLLLVDLSGSITQSGAIEQLRPAVQTFADRVGQLQKVAIYGFDGSTQLYPLLNFTKGGDAVRSVSERLSSFKGRDPSTNLNGAVVEGLKVLEKAVAHEPTPLKFGSLVVFTDGSDRAQRVLRADLDKALDAAHDDRTSLYVIGIGKEINNGELRNIGRTHAFLSQDPAELAKAFDDIAQRVEAYTKSFYLLSYCSPARAQEHDLKVVTKLGASSGSLSYHFNAQGFGPNCDSNRLPHFDLKNPTKRKASASQSD